MPELADVGPRGAVLGLREGRRRGHGGDRGSSGARVSVFFSANMLSPGPHPHPEEDCLLIGEKAEKERGLGRRARVGAAPLNEFPSTPND